jgi:hypothetical protein
MSFEPLTAREALLEIRRQTRGWDTLEGIDKIAQAGLDQSAPPNFELTDQLADRLAEAHFVLREAKRDQISWSAIDEVLALPPDLEAMVERRIGHS